METPVVNALSVDLEDWPQSVLSPTVPITDCVVRNTDRVLELLDRHGVRATFFALGKVCEKFPQLLPRIASAGHEIASHGYGHEIVHTMTPQQFRSDVERSIEIIESQTGQRPIGYRAPAFSITRTTSWAGPILSGLGIRYSSSIFPFRGRRYGMPDAPRFRHRWPDCDLIEMPLTTARVCGRNWPVAGGGYLRLFPASVLSRAIRSVNRTGQPAVLYLHPYELAPGELKALRRHGWRIRSSTTLTQGLFRSRCPRRLELILQSFPFNTLADVLQLISQTTQRPPARTGPPRRLRLAVAVS